jgi:hypothetical protein
MRMRSASTLLFLALIPLFSTPALAVQNDSQVWTTAAVNVKLSDKWRLSNELTVRFSNNRNGLYDLEADHQEWERRNRLSQSIPIVRGGEDTMDHIASVDLSLSL